MDSLSCGCHSVAAGVLCVWRFKVTDIEAIVKSGVAGVGPFTGTLDGVSLWSNGHLMVAGEYPGKDYGDALPKLWVKIRDRADQPAETGGCILSEDKRYVSEDKRYG